VQTPQDILNAAQLANLLGVSINTIHGLTRERAKRPLTVRYTKHHGEILNELKKLMGEKAEGMATPMPDLGHLSARSVKALTKAAQAEG
jgi:hypothetical protein